MELPAIPKSLLRRIREEDTEVLRSKFVTANHLVEMYENAVKQFKAYVQTQAILHEQDNPSEVFLAVKTGMTLLSQIGAAQSLIETELATVRAAFKQDHMGREEELVKLVFSRFATIQHLDRENNPAAGFSESIALAHDILV